MGRAFKRLLILTLGLMVATSCVEEGEQRIVAFGGRARRP